jgi:hypothetical protein
VVGQTRRSKTLPARDEAGDKDFGDMFVCKSCGGGMKPLLNQYYCPKDCDRTPAVDNSYGVFHKSVMHNDRLWNVYLATGPIAEPYMGWHLNMSEYENEWSYATNRHGLNYIGAVKEPLTQRFIDRWKIQHTNLVNGDVMLRFVPTEPEDIAIVKREMEKVFPK